MRKNSMTKCAVGAMLFGGTLGLAQSASAAVVNAGGTVTFLATAPGTAPSYALAYSGIGLSGGFSGGFGSVNNTLQSSFTRSGTNLQVTASVAGSSPVAVFADGLAFQATRSGTSTATSTMTFYRVFTVTGGMAVFAGSLSNNGATSTTIFRSMELYLVDPVTGVAGVTPVAAEGGVLTGNQSLNFSGTLAEGTYSLFIQSALATGTYTNTTYATFNIPAPGAMALLGAAGLVGSRRRRS